ncbi:lytic polysaccharide monooxygenase [Paludibacterium paludis]|uniref:Chitin-binding protein CbpD n=1 Tax=Paludibacterium paludis TaxID=1225769 RepID=A0A918P593_9NEIS|nr:lytic polysaccharide monooxygenase [Paludibacterium paludis]GGY21005.1 chitin-binding protein CbpD [Paludibacterium paludis]
MNVHLTVLALAAAPALVMAHGTMEVPANRVYTCFLEGPEEPQSPACIGAANAGGTEGMYNWNGINQLPQGDNHQAVVPDGTLCAGGNALFKPFDTPRRDWRSTTLVPDRNGRFEFVYYATAPHATRYFRFYVTRNGWSPDQPLKWSDLELFYTWNGNAPLSPDKRYRLKVPLPVGKTGQHIIYHVWKRSDSEEAFYSCSDVRFAGNAAGATTPWQEAGRLSIRDDLPAGSTVTLRLFNQDGQDIERHSIMLDATSGKRAAWPAALAAAVNRDSAIVRIGELDRTGRVAPATGGHRVYLNGGYPGYRYEIDLKTPTRR